MRDLFSKASIFGAFALVWICGVAAYVLFTHAPPGAPSPWVFVGLGAVWLAAAGELLWDRKSRR